MQFAPIPDGPVDIVTVGFSLLKVLCGFTSSLVSLAIANPVSNAGGMAIPLARHESLFLNSNETIDLDAITSYGILVREKILSGLPVDNYERNTGTMHPFAVKRSDSESGTGRRGASLPLTTFQNNLWMAEISIGTPAKTLKVTIDSGAADMWVLGTGCDAISEDRVFWDPNLSDSAKDEQKSFRIKYADGSIVKGDRFTDNVTVGEFTADPQTFGSATSYKTSYNSLRPIEYPQAVDGLLGLAFPSISRFGADPLFKSLVKQNSLINPTLSFKLTSSGAEMYIGGANRLLYSGDIVYTPVTQPGFWQVSMDDVLVNGNTIFENVPAIFDSGANFIFGDWNLAPLVSIAPAAPCSSLQTLSFTFGGKTFDMPPTNLHIRPVGQDIHGCVSSIIAHRSTVEFWTIGSAFLQGVYTVFDYGTSEASQVGFANLA